MATFDEVLVAVKKKLKFKHEDWYDGQWVLWDNDEKHLQLSPKFLLSDKWHIQEDIKPVQKAVDKSANLEVDDSVKKTHYSKK